MDEPEHCERCSKPKVNANHCALHAEYMRLYNQMRYLKMSDALAEARARDPNFDSKEKYKIRRNLRLIK